MKMEHNSETVVGTEKSENRTLTSLDDVRRWTNESIATAFESREAVLIDAPPGAGKTTSIPNIIRQTGKPTTYLTAREDLYAQMKETCTKAGLTSLVLSSPQRDCPTFDGDHGESLMDEVKGLYRRGYSARRLHSDRHLPCEPCPYVQAWDFNPENVDIIIGHYKHAYVNRVIDGRIVVLDEFPGNSYITSIPNPEPIVTEYVTRTDTIPYTDYDDLLQNRGGNTEAVELQAFNGVQPERRFDLAEKCGHALAPVLTLALIGMWDLENGFESTTKMVQVEDPQYGTVKMPCTDLSPAPPLLSHRVIVRNKNTDELSVLNPPDLSHAEAVIGLDGTPTPVMWNLMTGIDFTHSPVLSKSELKEYISDILDTDIIQINRSHKPYQNARNVTSNKDTKLLFWVWLREGQKPALITSKTALDEYQEYNGGEPLEYVTDSKNFAQVRSSNDFKDEHLGFISGSRHYGDRYIKRWGAFSGQAIEPNDERGCNRDYGEFGNKVLQHMHRETIQDALRFGRNAQHTRVYVNTSVLPAWVPSRMPDEWMKFSEGARAVIACLQKRKGDALSQEGLTDQTGLSKRRVRSLLKEFTDCGYIEKHPQTGIHGTHLYEWKSYR